MAKTTTKPSLNSILGNTPPPSAPTSTAPTTANTNVTAGGSFPQSPSADPTAASILAAYNTSAATQSQFFGHYGISSTEQPTYQFQTGQQIPAGFKVGDLNQNALDLIQFYTQSEADRTASEDLMVNAGQLTAADANGTPNSTAVTAFKNVLTLASQDGVDAFTWLNSQGTGTSALENQVASLNATGEKNETAPVAVTETNPTTAAADLTQAFNQATGITPTQAQINSFIAQVQGQDVTNQTAIRTEGQEQVAQAKADTAALEALGPDGIDQIAKAYASAVSGASLPQAPGGQGPATGSVSTSGNYLTPGSKLPPDTTVGFNPSGTEMVANVPGTSKTTTEQVPPGGVAQLEHAGSSLLHLINPLSGWSNSAAKSDITGLTGAGTPYTSRQVTTTTPGKGMATAPNLPVGAPGTTPTGGGIYAMSNAEWQAAQKAIGTSSAIGQEAQKAKTAGAAPVAVQTAAWTNWMLSLYNSNGNSMSKAIVTAASGSPLGPKEGSHTEALANSIATQVNNQIMNEQNTINNSDITVKTSAPDVQAEAAQLAKNDDPTGYYAANFAGWGSFLTKLLYGTPLTAMPSATDTFNGPVGSTTTETGSASPIPGGTAAAPATTQAPAPAPATPAPAASVAA